MDFNCKIKDKHYKNSRFSDIKENGISFKTKRKENIIQDVEQTEQKTSIAKKLSFLKMVNQNEIEIPKNENECLHIITQRQHNSFSLLMKFIEHYGRLDYLQIMTYTIDRPTLLFLLDLLQKNIIKKSDLIITETIEFRSKKIYDLLISDFSNRTDVNLSFFWVHSKILLIKKNNAKFVIDGSGNFSQNALVEHYNIWRSSELFEFHQNITKEVFFGDKIRKKHIVYKNWNQCREDTET